MGEEVSAGAEEWVTGEDGVEARDIPSLTLIRHPRPLTLLTDGKHLSLTGDE
ncbi:MAG: hypothetical protein U9R36_04150 [Elusimicrobiota bacterium]|nr:hypothetical protein [Elusimicrobiota bacterium]